MLPLDPFLDRIRPLLATHGRPVYLVGGVVRDALLGRDNHDIDLIVAAGAIDLTFDLARRLGLPAYRLDEERDVGRILVPDSDTTLDIARFRGDTLADDLRARDFTINALALPVAARTAGEVIDNHGGLADLAAGRIGIIHANSIADDPVRALRAARFATQLDFTLTDETITAVRAAGPLLTSRTSPERVRDELNRLLLTDRPYDIIGRLHELDLLGHVLPEIAALSGVAQSPPHHEDVQRHTFSVLAWLVLVERIAGGQPVAAAWAEEVAAILSPHHSALAVHLAALLDGGFSGRLLLRWGALLHDIGKPATQTIDETGRIRFLGHDETGAGLARARLNRLKFSGEAVRRVRDYAQVRSDGAIAHDTAMAALDLMEIDVLGLDDLDRRVLRAIIEKFGGGPVGLETIGASISEESDTIMDVVEPYLLQLGFLERTSRGRMATAHAYRHLGLPIPDTVRAQQPGLFAPDAGK